MTIRLLIPSMPSPMACLPFWNRMHASKQYVNGGPLVMQLQDELETKLGLGCTMVSNGTVAIELALRALGLEPGSRILVPAVTFPATGLAVRNAGHQVVIADVDQDAQLTPDIARDHPDIDAVIPVATYGLPVDASRWFAYAESMNIPVVVDAAGALLDQVLCGSRLVHFCFSLHATKFIGCGEGGLIASGNPALLTRIASMAAFGENGTNAKLDEVRAAVGLASLRTAPERALHVATLMAMYRSQMPAGVTIHGDTRVAHRTILPVLMPTSKARERLETLLEEHGIGCKQWYRPFLDERTDIGARAPIALRQTNEYRQRCIGLPFHQELKHEQIVAICGHVREALQ